MGVDVTRLREVSSSKKEVSMLDIDGKGGMSNEVSY
jgi:hypothetical protein